MIEPIDEFFVDRAEALRPVGDLPTSGADDVDRSVLLALFDAQAESRHIDLAARWLQAQGRGYYTIASAGHEANAAIAMATRVDDPALLHYRSGAFYAARAAMYLEASRGARHAPDVDPVRDVVLGLVAAADEPMSGGRHKVFGHPKLSIIPQTSTIASHLPRAVGLAYTLGLPSDSSQRLAWPEDAIVVCSFGDASVNHSTAQGAFNAAAYMTHRNVPAPILFVCEDNGIGISTPTPAGWVLRALGRFAEFEYMAVDGSEPVRALRASRTIVDTVRETRRPAVLHLRAVRLMGHAGSDVESAYRSRSQIAADFERDPLLATAAALVDRAALDGAGVVERYEWIRDRVMAEAAAVLDAPMIESRDAVMAPLAMPDHRPPRIPRARHASDPGPTVSERSEIWAGKPPEKAGRLTLAHAVNAALTDALITYPAAAVFGQDVAAKGGVYGVTRGLRKRLGAHRVFDAILDEQTILGTALGMALAGRLPIPEIQYLAYLHNAEDQLRGEGASLRFFSAGQYQNGMVVRIAGLAYQRGFGGHFHNDNSVAVLRDIPGIVVCVPSHPYEAPALLRTCVELADRDGRVCIFLEPIALYHERDLFREGDQLWTATYRPPWPTGVDPHSASPTDRPLGSVRTYGEGPDLLIVTFGNGVPMSLRAARTIAESAIASTVLDLSWIAPLPTQELLDVAKGFDHMLVVDETRATGGVAESVIATLVDAQWPGRVGRVTSADSFVPLGPAAEHVLLSEEEIVTAARALLRLRAD
ncbi:MAG TPA: thiamine pyrophosphate-dependent enzyme [Nocardioidaceae bacterium]|nr:thiamine pyrophosphate-dependent enzyme [Nocardioidaceae bacterium]